MNKTSYGGESLKYLICRDRLAGNVEISHHFICLHSALVSKITSCKICVPRTKMIISEVISASAGLSRIRDSDSPTTLSV